jgi:prophage antirepressor-like protein
MNELQSFHSAEFGEVRVVERENVPWFVAADVCRCLEIGNPSQALTRLDTDEKFTTLISNEGAASGTSSLAFVSEPGLYTLILGSRKPEARAFKRWITHEVIPSIRRHGAYLTPQTLEEALRDPDTIIRLATALKDEQARSRALEGENSRLTVENAIMAPKAGYFDELVDRNLLTNLRETAKQLHVRERDFVRFLLDKKYMYRDKRGKLMPYAQHVEAGLFEVKECFNEKTQWSGTQTLVTPKGRETFRLLYVA